MSKYLIEQDAIINLAAPEAPAIFSWAKGDAGFWCSPPDCKVYCCWYVFRSCTHYGEAMFGTEI